MEKRYIKLIAFDVAMAVLIVILYSPGLLALRPTDPGIIRPGLAIVLAIFIAAALVYANISVITRKSAPSSYRHLDIEKPSANAASSVLERYTRSDVVGDVAKSAASEIESAQRKQAALHAIIDSKFPKGSLTYDKFASVVDAATATLIKNSAILANRIQGFDVAEYRHMEHLLGSGAYRHDNIPDEIQEEKWRLYVKNRSDMDIIVAANEKLLLELDKFAVEIGKMDAGTAEAENSTMVQEVRDLIEQTKYYE